MGAKNYKNGWKFREMLRFPCIEIKEPGMTYISEPCRRRAHNPHISRRFEGAAFLAHGLRVLGAPYQVSSVQKIESSWRCDKLVGTKGEKETNSVDGISLECISF